MKSLQEKTLDLLKQDDRTMRQISEETDLPYDWLVGFKHERFKESSANRVQRLYEYLSGTKLPLK